MHTMLTILFGSENGNAEDLAKRIGWQAMRRDINVSICACDDYNVSNLINQRFVLFICSTTGIGEEPNNMKLFWKFIRRKDLPNDSLSSVECAVIGLGDSSYQKYNFVAKKLYKRLKELGANMLMELCLGDDQHDYGYNAAIDPWVQLFWSKVSNKSHAVNVDQTLVNSSFSVCFVDNNKQNSVVNQTNFDNCNEKSLNNGYNKYYPYLAKVKSNERVTAEDHFQDVRLIKLEISDDQSLQYSPGDVCVVCPQNSKENVDLFISLLNLNSNDYFIIEKQNHVWLSDCYYNHIPVPCSVHELVSKFLDIQSVPKRSFFELLWHFSQNELEKQKLKELSLSTSQQDLYEYCNRPKRSIVEVLADFPHTTPYIKFEYLFDLMPAITPRPFSIASDLNVNPNELHLLVAVVNYNTRLKKPRLGLCSNYLAQQNANNDAKVSIFIRKSTFKLPTDCCPILLIGPGTGVAPFRSFIQHRVYNNNSNNYLFFGCRYQNADFYLKDEWKNYSNKGYLKYFTAFSRENPDKKVYVQNILYKEKTLVWNMFCNNASIYVSGNAKQMPQQVRDTLLKIIEEEGSINAQTPQQFLNKYEAKGKLQFECWS